MISKSASYKDEQIGKPLARLTGPEKNEQKHKLSI